MKRCIGGPGETEATKGVSATQESSGLTEKGIMRVVVKKRSHWEGGRGVRKWFNTFLKKGSGKIGNSLGGLFPMKEGYQF